jgi:hypothetical protein
MLIMLGVSSTLHEIDPQFFFHDASVARLAKLKILQRKVLIWNSSLVNADASLWYFWLGISLQK